MILVDLDIKEQSKENNLDKMDLDYAVKYMFFEQEDKTVEAKTYRSLIKAETKKLWTTAKNIIKGEGFK